MYISGIGHVLSISGYHMAVVAGIVFFVVRALLALVPALALRRPIKKWAAFAALVAATFYLVLSGAEVATQRSFIMTAIVLLGVMVDRPALTLRTLSVAALAVLLLAPEAVVHPSFQMSFAATLALIALYEHGLPWMRGRRRHARSARASRCGAGAGSSALILASLVAGLATTPYAAYHFHRLAPYGVLANLLAMPVVSALVMPAGILGAPGDAVWLRRAAVAADGRRHRLDGSRSRSGSRACRARSATWRPSGTGALAARHRRPARAACCARRCGSPAPDARRRAASLARAHARSPT